jgi:hypothetical protein
MKFRYDDDEVREYHEYGRVEKGTVIEATEAPDYRWVPVKEKASHAS